MTAPRFDSRQRDDVRRRLLDIQALVGALGLQEGSRRAAGGVTVLCPHHGERHASCNVTLGPDGTPRVRCHSCGWTGDALTLIAEVRGYSLTDGEQFREVLAEGAEIAGMLQLAEELRDGRQPDPNRPEVAKVLTKPAPEYPPVGEVLELWKTCFLVNEDSAASAYLRSRAIDPLVASERGLLRVIGADTSRPVWAYCKGLPWAHTGHRLVTRAWTADGSARSVRAWQCDGRDYQKRTPPTGHRAQGLVLANNQAVELLRGKIRASRVIFTEGEPDFVSMATQTNDAVFGVGSGFWTDEHAKKIPNGTPILLMTDNDDAGDKYAADIVATLKNRCPLWRVNA
jgi:DNA primase